MSDSNFPPAPTGSILFPMGLNQVLADFFTSTAIGAVPVLLVIVFAGIGIRRSSPVSVPRAHR